VALVGLVYTDHGCALLQDLTSVQNLQKKHALLESDVASRQVCDVVLSDVAFSPAFV